MGKGPVRERAFGDVGTQLGQAVGSTQQGGGIIPSIDRMLKAATGRGLGPAFPDGDADPGNVLWEPPQAAFPASFFVPTAGRWAYTVTVTCGVQATFDSDNDGPLLPSSSPTDSLAGWRRIQVRAVGNLWPDTVRSGTIHEVGALQRTYYADVTPADDLTGAISITATADDPDVDVEIVSPYVAISGVRIGPTP